MVRHFHRSLMLWEGQVLAELDRMPLHQAAALRPQRTVSLGSIPDY